MSYIKLLPLWYKGGCLLFLEIITMALTKQVHFRLRLSTYDMLRHCLNNSAHRSMAALVDEILEQELIRRINKIDTAAETMRSLVRRDG